MPLVLLLAPALLWGAAACGDDGEMPGDSSAPADSGAPGDAGDGAIPDGSTDGAVPDAATDSGAPAADFHLPAGHFHPAVMAPELVYPRPDAETNDYARHRWAYPEVEYRLPGAVIQGGAWPFLYELVDGPPGATIGRQLVLRDGVQVPPEDYGVIRWTPGAGDDGATFDFHVRVTDQEDSTIDARWTVTVDPSHFVFVSEAGDDDNPGTIAEPFASTRGWFNDDASDAAHAGKLVYYRAGSYQPVGAAANDENLRINAGAKPMSFLAFPGESVVLDGSRAQWTFWAGCDDVFFGGLHFDGSKLAQPDGAPLRNSRNIAFYGTANQERITFFEVRASNIQPGNPADDRYGNDNPAFVWRPSTGTSRGRYWAFVGNDFEDAGPIRSNGPSAVSLSCVSFVVYEGNTVVRWSGTGSFYDKANVDHITQRNNDLWLATAGGDPLGHGLGAGMSDSYDPAHDPGDAETCWNRIRVDARFAVQAGVSSSPGDGPVDVYRNSIVGDVWFNRVDNYEASAEGNVIQGALAQDAPAVVSAGDNFHTDDLAEVVFDADGALTGAARTSYLGTHGAEVQ